MSDSVHSVKDRQQALHVNSSIGGDFPLDENVIAELPAGTKVLSADSFGSSAWTVTARISTELSDGTLKRYFLKCATEDAGRCMMEGEFKAMSELYKTMPSFVPKPCAWGEFKLPDPRTYFFLCDFIDMSNQLPEPNQLCARLAELHRISTAPTGKFGFHVPTCHGRFPQVVNWDSSWATFFSKLLADVLRLDLEQNGRWKELEDVSERVLTHVIPRLLGVLQADGRVLKPCLIHGDLWEGNIGTDFETGEIFIFDSGAYYAHNEMEIGMWRCERHKIRAKVYTKQYLRNFGMSEPVEEWDDRNRIYCVKMNMVHSAHHPDSIVRKTAYDDMCYLVEKYAPLPDTAR